MRAAQTDVPASMAPMRIACNCMMKPLRNTLSRMRAKGAGKARTAPTPHLFSDTSGRNPCH